MVSTDIQSELCCPKNPKDFVIHERDGEASCFIHGSFNFVHQSRDILDEEDKANNKDWKVEIPVNMITYLVNHPLMYTTEEMAQLSGYNESAITRAITKNNLQGRSPNRFR